MNILLWHVHGSWTTAFVQGKHRYLVPVTEDRGPWGRGRARTYPWPDTVEEVTPDRLPAADVDVVVVQRPEELALLDEWAPGRWWPKVYVEHNTPKGDVPDTRHPMAARDDLLVVHVTHFNELFWDCGGTRTAVVEHGVVEPGVRYRGDLERLAVVTNEPVRRGRVTGTDLVPRFAAVAPLDVFGMGVRDLDGDRIRAHEDPPQAAMHRELARRRAYLHLCRWTSLGLSLIEAMTIGLPVVALATTEAVEAVPAGAGILSTRVDTLVDAAHWLIEAPEEARRIGAAGRAAALARYGLDRFLADWDHLLEEELCASR
ncbi:glycosyltransferase [Dactylosporangium roseum]|uniref:Glycosyltransferase n=1 Tax=Dactylosporangium roseum TaxID=47989 RepID=A0ABY5YXC7_9ACTN|nr:glycosyltransferase [Dactylosporangium roseum]UWZ34054.1 glycosyltransferase [Dactylosporangium roseum]